MSAFYWDNTTPTPSFTWALSGGTLTVSTEGIAKMIFEKQGSPGDKIELDLSGMSWTIDDDNGSDEFVGSLGVTNSVLWGSAMPIFPYLINYDNTAANVRLGLSRDPTAKTTPAATTGIGYKGTAATVAAQTNFVVAYTNNTTLNSKPCSLIDVGLTITGTTQDGTEDGYIWTFAAPAAGDSLETLFSTTYTFPAGQNGAITQGGTATHLYVAGGDLATDVPTWATNQGEYTYEVDPTGSCTISFTTVNSGNCTNGDVAAQLYLALPYNYAKGTNLQWIPLGACYIANNDYVFTGTLNTGNALLGLYFDIAGPLNASNLNNANDDLGVGLVTYKAF